MTGKNGQEMRWGGGVKRQIIFPSSRPFLKLFRKERSRKEERRCGGHSFSEAMPLESERARPSQAAPSYGRRSVCKGLTALLVNLACLSGS